MNPAPLFATIKPLILASSSPRRKDMLRNLGIDFTTAPAHIDETPLADEHPEDFARRMACAKASVTAAANPDCWVIGADTVVTIEGRILGKPRDHADALDILRQLIGKTHQVITGVSLCHAALSFEKTMSEVTRVTFSRLPDALLEAYVRTGEPLDKAGAYGIQGIGSFLVSAIDGSCTNVIGLPLDTTVQLLLAHGIISPRLGD